MLFIIKTLTAEVDGLLCITYYCEILVAILIYIYYSVGTTT